MDLRKVDRLPVEVLADGGAKLLEIVLRTPVVVLDDEHLPDLVEGDRSLREEEAETGGRGAGEAVATIVAGRHRLRDALDIVADLDHRRHSATCAIHATTA